MLLRNQVVYLKIKDFTDILQHSYSWSYAQHGGHYNKSYNVMCDDKIKHLKNQIRAKNILEIHVIISLK